jgi:hypothetical protein
VIHKTSETPGSPIDRGAPRMPRPEGRGRGELSQDGKLLFREAPPERAGRLHLCCPNMTGHGGRGKLDSIGGSFCC